MRHLLGHWAWVFHGRRGDRRDDAGRPLRVAGVHLDIDRTKRAEGGDRRSAGAPSTRSRNCAPIQTALDKHAIVAVTDPSGTIRAGQRPLSASASTAARSLIGQMHRIVCPGAHPREFWADMCATSAGAQLAWREVATGPGRLGCTGSTRPSIPVLDNHGHVIEHVAIRTEITQRKQPRARAARRDRQSTSCPTASRSSTSCRARCARVA